MAKKQRSREPEPSDPGIPRGWGEFLGVALLAIGALMAGGLISYQFGDGNLMGPVGRLVAAALYAGFGMAAYLVVLGVVGIGVKALLGHRMELRMGEGIGFSSATLAGCVLLHVMFPSYRVHGYTAGGLSGELLGEVSIGLFDHAGTYLLTVTVMCLGLIASTPLTFGHLLVASRAVGRGGLWTLRYLWSGVIGIAQAQREYAEQKWDESEAPAADADDYEEEAEAEAEEELEEEEEEEAELEEEEEEEEEEEDEEEDDEPAELVAASKKKSKSTRKSTQGKRARKNRKRSDAAAIAGAETEPADQPELAVAPEPSAAPQAPGSDERPEICVSEDPDLLSGPDADDDDDDGDELEAAANDDPADADGKPGRKKAPLTPAEIAARARAKRAEAVGAASEAKLAPRRDGAQPVQYLQGAYELPPLHLFAAIDKTATKAEIDTDFIYEQAGRIVEAFAHFKIRGKVTKIHPGPVITRYEFKPEAGVKVSRIQNLENDLAMALEAIRIRILAPIPGKSTVGLEVPNKERETVYLQENLADPGYEENGGHLPLVLGKDIVGKAVSIDLGKSPHLLVAGATGSGKSVGVNAMLCSLLYSCTPDQLRLILIDPKMLEFSIYRDIPHLLLPVITDAEKANLALRWAVNEMERRYALLSSAKVRDIKGYNKKMPQLQAEWDGESKALEAEAAGLSADAMADGEDAVDGSRLSGVQFDAQGNAVAITGGVELPPRPEAMPYIVIVIDEFADLMMVASKEVECNVARLAAKARAAGVHLILATQRPSVDVITGTIKNNFPSRIAFQVTSDIDSRTILDQKGAKQLLGMGDMLYMDRGKEPRRIHGCFVSEAEIEKVVDFVRKQAKASYNMEITKAEVETDEVDEERAHDPLYDKAVQLVAEAQKVSTSMLQRRLNVGYNRAAKIVERMEEDGAIGPPNGSKPREVFVSAA
ncbi:FtsK/SpoIIIE family DNA translocase [Enhygromyxa salina]|uniref:DNA translocase FtsK n=1 Tax=Enhygromyxa salina TaxID=215803 RepID=A0A2S9Y4A4_9BACT|nr:DNA translocase FtsK 4TM domain-containing protein [Enhygromyxa salina]PRP99929.1 DNA translocase FtsK [Enhygromyxa salina]